MKKLIPHDAVLLPDMAQRVFEGEIFDVYQWPQQLFDGSEHTFEMLKRADTVNAICVVGDQIIALTDEQPHLGTRESLPGGRVDQEDESILAAVQREIHEETGYSFSNWRLVQVVQPYRKMEWFVYTWLAWETSGQDDPHIDAGEKISVQLLDFETLKGKITARQGYLTELQGLFQFLESVDDLQKLPEFSGQEVDR